MTDRVFALSVALEQNIREDEVEPLIEAIKLLRGVLDVQTHIADISSWTAETRARTDLARKLQDQLFPTRRA